MRTHADARCIDPRLNPVAVRGNEVRLGLGCDLQRGGEFRMLRFDRCTIVPRRARARGQRIGSGLARSIRVDGLGLVQNGEAPGQLPQLLLSEPASPEAGCRRGPLRAVSSGAGRGS